MKQREELGVTSEYLFVKKKGNEYVPAVTSTANTFAKNISDLFNIEYYSHSSRHYFCTYLRGMNLPDEVIRLIFSWESTDLIKIYDDTPVDVTLGKFFKSFGAGDTKVKGE